MILTCTKCGERKRQDKFVTRTRCRTCRNDYIREWNRNGHGRALALRFNYGIEVEEYEAMALAQDGKCAICRGVNPSGQRLGVDHNHATGRVRGLLCHSCNSALGKFKDNAGLLWAALTYLERNGEL